MSTTTTDGLHEVLIELGFVDDQLTPDALLRDELDIDSTELVEVAALVMRGTGVRISGKDLFEVKTLGHLAERLDELGARAQSCGA